MTKEKRPVKVSVLKKKPSSSKQRISSKTRKKTTEKRKQQIKKRQKIAKRKRLIKEFSISLLIFLTLLLLSQRFIFTFAKMEGYSMLPTINNGEIFWINRLGNIRRFQMVYYLDPVTKETSIRRVVALPGEQLVYKEDRLMINNNEQVERFLEETKEKAKETQVQVTEDFSLQDIIGDYVLPENEYFVLGDNRSYATDSRSFGTIKKENIIGVVDYRIFPIYQWKRF